MRLPYLPPEQKLAVASVVLVVVSAAGLWLLHRIDQAVALPAGGAR